jgi:alkyldihydroxyacetonephosphate synthase
MPDRVRTPNAVDALPDSLLVELRALLGDRLLLGERERRERASDWWPLSKFWAAAGDVAAMPAAVVLPESEEELRAVLALSTRERIPVTPSAGRSSVCGQSVPVAGGVVLDLARLNGIVELDEESLTVTVEPGVYGHDLEASLRERGYTHGHFPQSIELSTVGGWLACRSAGQYSTRYGRIEDIALGFDVALASGASLSFPPLPADATGPDLRRMFLGSEGTLGVFTRITLRIRPAPPAERHAAYGFGSFTEGLDAVRRVLRRGARPAVVRLYDVEESGRVFDASGSVLIVLAEGQPEEIAWELGVVAEECEHELDASLVDRWLEHRNDVSALGHAVAAGLVVDTIETTALWRNVPRVYADVRAAVASVPGTLAVTAHCSHAYTSGACLYFTFAGAPEPAGADAYYANAWEAALDSGAAPSHHHGVGLLRARRFAEGLSPSGTALLQAVKDELDPAGILNPGKLGLEDRLGVGTPPWPPS